MRCCLTTLALLVALVIGVAWIGLPVVAGGVLQSALGVAGFSGQDTSVKVQADPPLKLLSLSADSVRIRSTAASFKGINAATVDVAISDVALSGGRFATIVGTLGGVDLANLGGVGSGPAILIPTVSLSGSSSRTVATMTIPAATVQAYAAAQVQALTGVAPDRVALAAPDLVRITLRGVTISARLVVGSDGSLSLAPPAASGIGALVLIDGSAGGPLRVQSVAVVTGGLRVSALLDLGLG